MQELLAVLPPFKPLLNIFTGLAAGLFFASFLEALNLTKYVAKFMRPFVRSAHLCDISAASFALALFSPASANAILGEALQNKKLSEKEVIISNLFNSLPSTLTHIPTFFFMSFPIIGKAAVIYTAISFISALIRTAAMLLVGRFLLPASSCGVQSVKDSEAQAKTIWRQALLLAFKRFAARLPRFLFIGIPVYFLMFYLQYFGCFKLVENWLVHSAGFDFLKAESLGIIVLYMAAELRASLVAAGTVYQAGLLGADEVVLALLIGNVLSTPMRGIRHQLPAYVSYYPARFAVKLLCCNQFSRVLSTALVAFIFYYWGTG